MDGRLRILCLWVLLGSISAFSLRSVGRVSVRGNVRSTGPPLSTPSFLLGWLENLFNPAASDPEADSDRRRQYPEQYPATYELNDLTVDSDDRDARLVRPLLRGTQIAARPLRLAYAARTFTAQEFHRAVDGRGPAVVLCRTASGSACGGYNPKGWASLGGARPSVAAFLFYERGDGGGMQKLRKVGGGGLACARDDPDFGISFGPDGLVVPMQKGRGRLATSKLGTYFERGPEEASSLFGGAGTMELRELKVLVGVYGPEEEIPYAGGVLDMTSG